MTDPATMKRSQRINLRVEPEADELLREAARIEHKSLSAFLMESALERARQVLEADRRIVIPDDEFDRIFDELARPARVVEPLLELAERSARYRPTSAD
jgi:uncharacterized protein (DUF1778 family)